MNYPPGMTLRPIDTWPKAHTTNRKSSPFRAGSDATLKLLRHELHKLGDGGPNSWYDRSAYPPSVLQIALRERDFRRTDGMPRLDARPSHPGVILTIELPNRTSMSLPCDTFDDWTDNLRAIALTLEALRKMDRFGVTKSGEQYTGWLAIEQQGSVTSPQGAVEVLARTAGLVYTGLDMSPDNIARLYRAAARAAHPDRNGGDQSLWDTVERAASFLRATGYLK